MQVSRVLLGRAVELLSTESAGKESLWEIVVIFVGVLS
jgi:hypothetical protein